LAGFKRLIQTKKKQRLICLHVLPRDVFGDSVKASFIAFLIMQQTNMMHVDYLNRRGWAEQNILS